jgi:hypothetical protein
VDRTIKTILEVSRDLRQMTGSLGTAFSWFDEALRITDAARRGEQEPLQGAEAADYQLRRSEVLEPDGGSHRPQLLETPAPAPAEQDQTPEMEEIGELEPMDLESLQPPGQAAEAEQPPAAVSAEAPPSGQADAQEELPEELEELEALEEE